MPHRVLILGHSFVNRLCSFVANHPDWVDLGFYDIQVQFSGIGGGTLRNGPKCISSQSNMEVMKTFHPHAVVLQIGGNDLSDPDCDPGRLARDIIAFAQFLISGYGVSHVIICQLFPRFAVRCYAHYNDHVYMVNNEIGRLLQNNSNISLWHNRGFWKNPRSLIGYDGVHLNHHGMVKYARNMRAAIGINQNRGYF